MQSDSTDATARTSRWASAYGAVPGQFLVFWRAHPAPLVFTAALALRVAFILAYGAVAPPPQWGDDPYYDSIATRLVLTREYINTWYPPGYPLFLAIIYAVCGHSWFAVRLLQSVLGAATCALTYRLATKMWDARVAWFAGALFVLYPGHAYMSWRIMAETLFIFLLVLALNIAAGMRQRPRLREAVALGLIIAIAQLVKSNLFVLPAFVVMWSALTLPGEVWRRLALAGALTVTLVTVSLATPLANSLSTGGDAAALPGNAGSTFWMANNPLADGYYIHAEMMPLGRAFIEAHGFTDRIAQASDFEKDRLYRALAVLWIRENPRQFFVLCLNKLNNAFGLFPRAVTLEGNPAAQAVHLLSYGLIAPFALVGLICSLRRWRSYTLLYIVLLSYVAMVVIFYGTPRFTLIVMPILVLFAGSAVQTCAHYLARVRPLLAARLTRGDSPATGQESAEGQPRGALPVRRRS